ncbi:hypothetical protein ACFYS8_12430 [Kitasatospora sp. NPDC004615]|uniref:hypothetical protein n=1 Tax=unclassified Kitasatospora TaxID=2633591 RepID=UPI0036920290
MTNSERLLDLIETLANHLDRESGNSRRPADWPTAAEIRGTVEEARAVLKRERMDLDLLREENDRRTASLQNWYSEIDTKNAPMLRNTEKVRAADLRAGDTILIEAQSGRYRTAGVQKVAPSAHYSEMYEEPMVEVTRTGRSTPEPFGEDQPVLRKIK